MIVRAAREDLHRNVLYWDGAGLARQLLPFTAAESFNPEDLWSWMQAYEDKTGGRVLTLYYARVIEIPASCRVFP